MLSPYRDFTVHSVNNNEGSWTTGAACLKTSVHGNSLGAAEDHGAADKQSDYAGQTQTHHFLTSKTELQERGAKLTFILWKLMLQLAPALEGMNLSPCLLGEDIGELEGVRVLLISDT